MKGLDIARKNKLMLSCWFIGMAAAEGAVSTIIAFIFPPWAWYLTAEIIVYLLRGYLQ